MKNQLLYTYQNGTYSVEIYSDGTKIRSGESFFPDYPESIDLKITNYCNLSDLCVYCHEMSNKKGKHSDIKNILNFLNGLPNGVEIAIGGGNPLSHPEINTLCDRIKSMNLIPNITVNQIHYDKEKIPKSVYGVGISFRNRKIVDIDDNSHIIWHLILGVHTLEDFKWLCQNYTLPKILWLGYKTVGNGDFYKIKNSSKIDDNINSLIEKIGSLGEYTNTIAFDNLAIQQIGKDNPIFKKGDYMGDDGKYSFYYDAVEDVYSIGSSHKDRIPTLEKNAIQIFKQMNNNKEDLHVL